jgi:uncharacterized protein (DUF488 family)
LARDILYSVGHGSRSAQDFLSLLRRHGIDCLVDVRAYPRSKRHPQFSRLALEASLSTAGIRYLWEGAALGGMRRPRRDSPHAGLADAAFRGYADHMATTEFAEALSRLADLGAARKAAFMCAETLPQHCHRAFIADALVAGGVQVWHLVGLEDTRPHALNPAARRADGALVYDAGSQLALAF